jgi:thiamine pyrophosphate-dependent acetolactate synthase large subunit-like protein
LKSADLIVGIGTRFDDRLTSTAALSPPRTDRAYRRDPARSASACAWICHRGDARNVLRALVPLVAENHHPEWVATISEWRADSHPATSLAGIGRDGAALRGAQHLGSH